jgi:hypothetical protein
MKALMVFLFYISFSLIGFSQGSEERVCKITAPNVVTLNCGDSLGPDYQFRVRSNCLIQNFELSIYNRWGELLYSSNDIDEYWDASEIPMGTYYYVVQGKWKDGTELNEGRSVNVLK